MELVKLISEDTLCLDDASGSGQSSTITTVPQPEDASSPISQLYTPLSASGDGIRLVKLLPSSSFDAPIVCQLFDADLQFSPRYEALSYVWGRPPFTSSIQVSTVDHLLIGENLELALRYLRLSEGKRVLWVDAISINQADVEERSQQVERMKNIFRLSDSVLIWLGPYPSQFRQLTSSSLTYYPSIDSPFELAGSFEENMEKTLAALESGLDLMRKISDKDASTLKDMEERMDETMKDPSVLMYQKRRRAIKGDEGWLLTDGQKTALTWVFKYSPVWERVWIMQEISCGRRVMLIGGHVSVSWEKISSFLEHPTYADGFHAPFKEGYVGKMAPSIFSGIHTIQHQRAVIGIIESGYVSRLLDVLARFQHTEATDLRDKIYGLLGLISESHTIPIDFNKTYRQVFIDVTASLINKSENLDILCQSPWGDGDSTDIEASGLPSWVPDFRRPGHSIRLLAQPSIHDAGYATCKTPCKIIDGILALKGIYLGEVGHILPGYTDDKPYRECIQKRGDGYRNIHATIPREWMQKYFGTSLLDDPTSTYVTGESSLQAYWRTLLANCKCYPIKRLGKRDVAKFGETFTSVLRGDLAEEALCKQEYWAMLSRMLRYWTFTMTVDGLYAMVMSHVKEGDSIVVLRGAKLPMILRPVNEEENEGRVKYKLISTAYIHGFMNGEAIWWADKVKQEEEVFLLV